MSSREGEHAHARALQDLRAGRVQTFDHAAFLAAWGVTSDHGVDVEWVTTDGFTRQYERLRGRSRRAFAAALDAFVEDIARSGGGRPRFRSALHVRPVELEDVEPSCLSWSAEGRATFLFERDGARVPATRVVWLAIGPHGSPNRKGARNR